MNVPLFKSFKQKAQVKCSGWNFLPIAVTHLPKGIKKMYAFSAAALHEVLLTCNRFLAAGTESASRGMIMELTMWLSLVLKVVASRKGHIADLKNQRAGGKKGH